LPNTLKFTKIGEDYSHLISQPSDPQEINIFSSKKGKGKAEKKTQKRD
jgi:hypothetical protein